jgi:O-antigen/teichoic acid export membrane protein
MIVIMSSVTDLTRVSVSESIGRGNFGAASEAIEKMTRRAYQLACLLIVFGFLLAIALPWTQILHAGDVSSAFVLRSGICATVLLAASAAPGAVYMGILHAQRRVALTQSFPGIAATLSFAAVALAWLLHLGLFAFVVAPAIAACAPSWIAYFWGHGAKRAILLTRDTTPSRADDEERVPPRPLRVRDLVIISGAGAPPLYSTGLDPIVLSIARGPVAVAAFGLASKIGVLVVLLPSALYPLYWANFSRLRSQGDVQQIRRAFRRELTLVVTGTAVLGAAFVALGPWVGQILSHGEVPRPMLLYWTVAALGLLASVQTITLPLLGGRKTAPKIAGVVYGLIIPNEFLSYFLSRRIGPAGPILASIIASIVLLAVCFMMVARDPRCLIDPPVRAKGKGPDRG